MKKAFLEAKTTLVLALPIALGQVSQMLMAVLDSAMVGHVGTVPLAASAFAGSVFGLFYITGLGLCMPVAVLVSRARGEGSRTECGEWLRHGAVVAAVTGAVMAVCMEFLGTKLGQFNQPTEVVAAAQPFFSLIALSLIPALIFQAFRQYAESMGRPWLPMAVMLAGVGVNVILNWLLIFGHWGAPAMGLAGAGVATLVARCFDLVVLYAVLRSDAAIRTAWPQAWLAPITRARLAEMLAIGLPASGQLICEAGAFTVAAWMMGRLGTVPLAAHQIALSCASMTFMLPLAISMASGMRVSRAMGEGRPDLVRSIGFGSLTMAVVVMGISAIVYSTGGRLIAQCYVRELEVVALATRLLAVAALFQLFDGCQVVAAGLLRGLADMKVPTLITVVAYWGVMLPSAYFWGVRLNDPVGVWRALAFGLCGAALLLVGRFLKRSRHLEMPG